MDSKATTERVGRYQLLEPIGGGPNGMVSRAKVFGVAGFERQFAVKRFAPDLTVGAVAQALSAAARSYGSLEHPRIARMSEFGIAQGQTFTAVEYVAGLDAFRLLQEAKLAGVAIAPGGALALVSQAARAVGYAHGRGLSHLGLSPTNVIVTVDGDVKVTDFGILAATMPARPTESPRLAHRIPYLAPEQLASESTSAATDVFVLGVIAYELVTGQRAYRGETPAQIAQAILGGPPAEPPLPRPIVRVLQRCLARSPFERFPDARALADALDAALRVAPVPGTRKDIGTQVKTTLERYASLNEGNLSGMVALNLQSGPPSMSREEYLRDNAKTDVSPVVSQPGATQQDIPKQPFTTVAGLAPPPIPVPPGVTGPPNVPPVPPGVPAKTILGLAANRPKVPPVIPPIGKPAIPTIKPPSRPPPVPSGADEIIEPSGLIEVTDAETLVRDANDRAETVPRIVQIGDSGQMPVVDPATMQGIGPGMPVPPAKPLGRFATGENFESQTGEMSSAMRDELNKRSVKTTGELQAVPKPSEMAATQLPLEAPARDSFIDDQGAAYANELKAAAAANDAGASEATTEVREPLATAQTMLAVPSPIVPPGPSAAPIAKTAPPPVQSLPPAAKRSKAPLVIAGVIALGGVAAAAIYVVTTKGKNTETVTSGSATKATEKRPVEKRPVEKRPVEKRPVENGSAEKGPAVVAKVAPDAGVAATAPRDAAVAVTATIDAATVAVATPDAAVAKPEVVKPTASSDKLQISSKPPGARVFIDGADQGVTPIKLSGSADRHTMVLLAPSHDLYIGEVDGHGVFDIALKPITPNGGQAGIKVLKCKDKERYYVYVDGQPTGMTCPTERIDTTVGAHVVEVYDIVTDSRRKFDVTVKDERLSARVRVDD